MKRVIVRISRMLLQEFRQSFQLMFLKSLDPDIFVFGRAGQDQFVEFGLKGGAVAVLRVLKDEDHQECNDRRRRVHHQLPGLGKIEDRTCGRPQENGTDCECECAWLAGLFRNGIGKSGKGIDLAGRLST